MDKLLNDSELSEFYGVDYYDAIVDISSTLETYLHNLNNNNKKLIEHTNIRIKSPDSVRGKLDRKGLEHTIENIRSHLRDIIGVRIVCKFLSDIYSVVEIIKTMSNCHVEKFKDYIKNPKPNGYRSYHLILRITHEKYADIYVEIQLRTISQDAWASLEHQMKYKQNIQNESLIVHELRRCATELASTDITMQTIYELINE